MSRLEPLFMPKLAATVLAFSPTFEHIGSVGIKIAAIFTSGPGIRDPSSLVPVGIVSGLSKMLQIVHYHMRNNCSPISRYAMHFWRGLPWNGVFLGGCSQLFHSTSESFVEARNIRDGLILKAERGVLHDFPDA